MKTYILFILFISLVCMATSCPEDNYGEDLRVDTSVMPPETQTGQGTFGYLMEEWIYVGGRYENPQNDINKKSIFFVYNEDEKILQASVTVNLKKEISFRILYPEEGKECCMSNVTFDGKTLPDLTAKITRFSQDNVPIISGTFTGGPISEGRFDTIYYIYSGTEQKDN